jgi:hypothetical protein
METKEAAALAKRFVGEVFAGERITELGLEAVEFDVNSGMWYITLGFSRGWDHEPGSVAAAMAGTRAKKRIYKVIRFSDSNQSKFSVINRDPLG